MRLPCDMNFASTPQLVVPPPKGLCLRLPQTFTPSHRFANQKRMRPEDATVSAARPTMRRPTWMHVATFTGIAPVGTVRRSARCACNRNGNAHDRNVFSFRVPRARISRSSEHPDESQVDLPERHTRESVESMSEMQTSSPGREDEFSDPNGDELEGATVGTLDRDTERSFDTVLQELTAIQQDGPRNTAILGTRYTSYLHQQIIELLTYANVLVGNHVFTSGAGGTNAAVIRGALRAEKPDLLTVVLPQSLGKQPKETQEQLKKVKNVVQMTKNDPLPLDVSSQLCNSDILSRCTHFIAFAFHDSDVVLESVRQAKELRIVVTVLYLD